MKKLKLKQYEQYIPYALGIMLFYLVVSYKEKKFIPVTSEQKKTFVSTMQPIATKIYSAHGINPLITLTQSALESGYGTSSLAKNGKNIFGIRATSDWIKEGKPVYVSKDITYIFGFPKTVSVKFKKYDSWLRSSIDWAMLISKVDRYKDAYKEAKQGDVKGFAKAIKKAGYAEDPGYTTKIVSRATDVQRYLV